MLNSATPSRDVVNEGASSVGGGIVITTEDSVHTTYHMVKPEIVGAVGGASKRHTLSHIKETIANAEKNGQGRYSPLARWEKQGFKHGAWHLQQCLLSDK